MDSLYIVGAVVFITAMYFIVLVAYAFYHFHYESNVSVQTKLSNLEKAVRSNSKSIKENKQSGASRQHSPIVNRVNEVASKADLHRDTLSNHVSTEHLLELTNLEKQFQTLSDQINNNTDNLMESDATRIAQWDAHSRSATHMSEEHIRQIDAIGGLSSKLVEMQSQIDDLMEVNDDNDDEQVPSSNEVISESTEESFPSSNEVVSESTEELVDDVPSRDQEEATRVLPRLYIDKLLLLQGIIGTVRSNPYDSTYMFISRESQLNGKHIDITLPNLNRGLYAADRTRALPDRITSGSYEDNGATFVDFLKSHLERIREEDWVDGLFFVKDTETSMRIHKFGLSDVPTHHFPGLVVKSGGAFVDTEVPPSQFRDSTGAGWSVTDSIQSNVEHFPIPEECEDFLSAENIECRMNHAKQVCREAESCKGLAYGMRGVHPSISAMMDDQTWVAPEHGIFLVNGEIDYDANPHAMSGIIVKKNKM